MKMPATNFSQNGLARIFGIDLDENSQAPLNTAHGKRTAIIAGTVCSVVGLAILVALGYAAWKWRQKHTHSEAPVFEKDVLSDVIGRTTEQVELQYDSLRAQQGSDGPV